MQRRTRNALVLLAGLGLALAVLGASTQGGNGRYDVELGKAQGEAPLAVRLDTSTGQLCAFVFDPVQQKLVARGCYPDVDRGL